MKYSFMLMSVIVMLTTNTFAQHTIYYNSAGEITMPEFATHYRVGKIDLHGEHFIGVVKEYRLDSSLLLVLNYNDSGLKTGPVKYINPKGDVINSSFDNNRIIDKEKLPDSVLTEILIKENFKKARYIRKNDYRNIKPVLIDESLKIDDSPKELFVMVEREPSFPGGRENFYEFLNSFLKYPDEVKKLDSHGKVYVQFIIDRDGTISNVHVLDGTCAACNEAVVRAIRKMPDWNPGYHNGNPVAVRKIIPIHFH